MTKVSAVANRKDKREIFVTVLVQRTPLVAAGVRTRRATPVNARRENWLSDTVKVWNLAQNTKKTAFAGSHRKNVAISCRTPHPYYTRF